MYQYVIDKLSNYGLYSDISHPAADPAASPGPTPAAADGEVDYI